MNKKRNWTRIAFILAAAISSATVIGILTSDLENKVDIILGVSSIIVTAILGIATYYQTKEQIKIDMLDKTPYFRIVKDTEYEHHADPSFVDANAMYEYTKFLSYGNHGDDLGAVVTLEFENISDCVIKKVTKYVCEDKKHSQGGKFVRYNDSKVVQCCATNEEKKHEYRNNFNLNEHAIDVVPNETFKLSVWLAKEINNIPKSTDKKSFDFSVALEIETVHGYVYTQYMEFTVAPVPVNTGADWVMIDDYDVDILSSNISKKYLR